ncbi:hypothetical protein [Siccirubricoccus sp. G192]|uniref:hypothetical protein n=1 Tax=Siccirubricoccus sp. G192 TaxID=2849651 RepID=UPI001C2BF376|nr:hypothetical protein [Siccirubricoccus sp. G192]MBV1799399.1 hypothetical protein [Siccirubricoccus sp. G192]
MNPLSASLVNESDSTIRGLVEIANPRRGIHGWTLDLAAPDRPLRVELLLDGKVVADCLTDRARDDIGLAGHAAPAAGFCFDAATCRHASEGAPEGGRFAVRVAAAQRLLRSAGPLPTAAEMAPPLPAEPAGGPPLPAIAVQENPLAALQVVEALAGRLLQQPLVPLADRVVGYIEAMAWEQTGLIWIFGWMQRQLPRHFPAVIVDGARYRAAAVLTGFARTDLPEDATGICGMLRTDWRPSSKGPAPWLHFGDTAQYALPVVEDLAFLSDKECTSRIEALRRANALEGEFTTPLRRLLATTRNWAPDNAAALGLEVRANLERLLVLPGFGCLAEGWVLSPLQPVSHFMLRVGRAVLVSEPGATSRKPRPDLLGLAPGGQKMVAKAGFVTAFAGRIEEEDLGEAVLKIVLADGSSTNHRVEPGHARIVGHSAAIEDMLALFPALHAEGFFPALSASIGERQGRDIRKAEAFALRPCREALVAVVPDDLPDMALLFDELSRLAWSGPPEQRPGIALLASAGQHRAAVLAHLHDLGGDEAGGPSLFFVADPETAIYALPEVLARLEAERFAFIGPHVTPSEAGWAALLAGLAAAESGPLVPAGDAAALGMDLADPAECFLWNRRDTTAWLQATPAFLGGLASRELALPAPQPLPGEGVAAWRGRRAVPGLLAQRINRHLRPPQAGAVVEKRDA